MFRSYDHLQAETYRHMPIVHATGCKQPTLSFSTTFHYQISLKSVHLFSGCYMRTDRGSDPDGRSADIRQGDANWCIFIDLRCEHVHNFFFGLWRTRIAWCEVLIMMCMHMSAWMNRKATITVTAWSILVKLDLNIMSLDISSFMYLLTSYPQQYRYETRANVWI
jgi:hypothetical protein